MNKIAKYLKILNIGTGYLKYWDSFKTPFISTRILTKIYYTHNLNLYAGLIIFIK